MRRPLGTGLPIALTGNSTFDTLFDLSAAPAALQAQTSFLTLYAIAARGSSGEINLRTTTDGDQTLIISNYAVDDLRTAQEGALSSIKVLDRFPMRGDSIVEMNLTSDPAANTVLVVGYFEMDGESDPPKQLRPLQPGALVAPFTYNPVTSFGNDPTPKVVHTLEPGYIDDITLIFRAIGPAASPHIVFSDGSASIDVRLDDGFRNDIPMVFLPSIPMYAAAAGAAISIYTNEADDEFVAYGYFTRR